MVDIKFNTILRDGFLGRNGFCQISGVRIVSYKDIVTIIPVTSKKHEGASYINIPKNKIQEIIDELERLKSNLDKTKVVGNIDNPFNLGSFGIQT